MQCCAVCRSIVSDRVIIWDIHLRTLDISYDYHELLMRIFSCALILFNISKGHWEERVGTSQCIIFWAHLNIVLWMPTISDWWFHHSLITECKDTMTRAVHCGICWARSGRHSCPAQIDHQEARWRRFQFSWPTPPAIMKTRCYLWGNDCWYLFRGWQIWILEDKISVYNSSTCVP